MSTRRRRSDATETSSPEASSAPKRVQPPEFDTCNFYSEAVNLIFDPKRVLHRRRQEQVRLRQFLPRSRLSSLRGIRIRKEERLHQPHSRR